MLGGKVYRSRDILMPHAIKRGANIRIISPSWPSIFYTPHRVARAEHALSELGFEFSYGKSAAEVTDDGISAGTAEQRADDIMEAFKDPAVDAVLCAAGGGTTRDVLPLLDGRVIRESRKLFIGYCDNVWLNHYLLEQGLYSYYGVAFVAHFGEPGGIFPEIVDGFLRAVLESGEIAYVPASRRTSQYFNWQDPKLEQRVRTRNVDGGWQWIRQGTGRGTFIGCGLESIPELIDHFTLNLEGTVLFWDVNVTTFTPLASLLDEVTRRTDISRLAGMVVGPNPRYRPEKWADIVSSALREATGRIDYPIVVNADIGHLDPPWIVPYGMTAVLDSAHGLHFSRQDR
jgi:muramoyltetrapeptide carboxypeptidase LdcA involved in peptidoglycan recycling